MGRKFTADKTRVLQVFLRKESRFYILAPEVFYARNNLITLLPRAFQRRYSKTIAIFLSPFSPPPLPRRTSGSREYTSDSSPRHPSVSTFRCASCPLCILRGKSAAPRRQFRYSSSLFFVAVRDAERPRRRERGPWNLQMEASSGKPRR